jgi:group I intron endonuclease
LWGEAEPPHPADAVSREQYYLDQLKPEYNILKNAGSSLGREHSEKSRAKMSVSKKGENSPMFGKTHSEKTISKNTASRASPPNSIKIEVLDLETKISTSYDSIGAASRALNISLSSISMYFIRNQKKPYKGRYIFKKID